MDTFKSVFQHVIALMVLKTQQCTTVRPRKKYSSSALPDNLCILLIFAFAVPPFTKHDGGIHIGWREGVGLIEQRDHTKQDGPDRETTAQKVRTLQIRSCRQTTEKLNVGNVKLRKLVSPDLLKFSNTVQTPHITPTLCILLTCKI